MRGHGQHRHVTAFVLISAKAYESDAAGGNVGAEACHSVKLCWADSLKKDTSIQAMPFDLLSAHACS